MTTTLATLAGVLLAFAGLIWAALRGAKSTGSAEAKVEAQQKIDAGAIAQANTQISQVEQANEVRDRLNTDPEYAKRMRDTFSRD